MISRTGKTLALVSSLQDTPIDRARRAASDARTVAMDLAGDLLADLADIASQCVEIGSLEALPQGQRDAITRLGQRVAGEIQSINGIRARAR